MEASQQESTQELNGFSTRGPCLSLGSSLYKLKARVIGLTKKMKKIGDDDPRRVTHSFKVGLALTLVSIFYYVTPLFVGFGVSAMWAILTVVVVMEYTVGGTLGKGVNRAIATLVGSALGVGVHHIASLCGEKGDPIVLGVFVFLLATAATYSRFLPEIKARYDYGILVFILTFSLVAVSSYREDELTQLAHRRLSTVAIGVVICVCCSIFVFPVWAGEDLHNLVPADLEKLASFLQGMGEEFYGEHVAIRELESMSFLQVYKSVLNSKPIEESLANLAGWEPGHDRFGFRHPWKQYLKIGALSRQCAYSMEALRNYIINSNKTKVADESELCNKIKSSCIDMSTESSKTLTELAMAIRTMTTPSPTNPHIDAAIAATIKLKVATSEEGMAVPLVIESAMIATILADIVRYVHQIAISVQELARLADFKSSELVHRATVKPLEEEP